jgi:hypothetical protein
VRIAAGFAERPDLLVQAFPVACQHLAAGNHDVDLGRAGAHRRLHLRQLQRQRYLPGREAGGNGGDRDPAAGQFSTATSMRLW